MKKQTLIAAALVGALAPAVSSAEEAKSPYTLTGNIGLFSQYIFRGLTQTNREPAVQGGFDFSHESGFYLGNWNSNVSWLTDSKAYASNSIEMDFYGGWRTTFADDFTFDIGTLYYAYPGNINRDLLGGQCCASANTWEGYFSLGWKWITFKNSFSLMSNTFGVRDSAGSWYGDLTGAYPISPTISGFVDDKRCNPHPPSFFRILIRATLRYRYAGSMRLSISNSHFGNLTRFQAWRRAV